MDTIDLNPVSESTDRCIISCDSSGCGLSHPMITIPFLSLTVKWGRLSPAFADAKNSRIARKEMKIFFPLGVHIGYKGNHLGLKNKFIVDK